VQKAGPEFGLEVCNAAAHSRQRDSEIPRSRGKTARLYYGHTHTEDYWGVVIAGVAVNGTPGSPDMALPVGSYWFQKGGERHITKCISPSECIFFISQNGKFDYLPDEKK
jgi:hypothetical protein